MFGAATHRCGFLARERMASYAFSGERMKSLRGYPE
jgi:hypothetical protein